MFIQRLDADGGEIGRLAVEVGVKPLNHAGEVVDGTGAGVGDVLQARNPVVGGQLGNLAALAVDPDDALTDGEGVGQAVVGDGVIGGEVGN